MSSTKYFWDTTNCFRGNPRNANVVAKIEDGDTTVRVRKEGIGYWVRIEELGKLTHSEELCHREEGQARAITIAEGVFDRYKRDRK